MGHGIKAALAAAGLLATFGAASPSVLAADLTWAPASASADAWKWDAGTTASWTNSEAGTQTVFHDGDGAAFGSGEANAPADRTITVDGGGGVKPSELSFSGGGDYVFEGGAITVGTALTLGGTGAVTFKNPLSTPRTALSSGTLGFVGAFDAGFFSAAGGTVRAAGAGVSVFTFSVPEGAESAVQCGWDKGAGSGISVRKKGAGKATLNVKKLFDALGGAANGRIYVDEGTLIGTGYDFYQNPDEMIYEVSNNATLTSTGAHVLGGYAGGIRVFLHPGATFSPVAGQYMGQTDPGLLLQGDATVRGDIRNEGKLYVKAEGTGNFIENLNKQYGNQLYIEVAAAGDELYVANLECSQAVTKTGAGMLLAGRPENFDKGKTFTVSAGTLAATNGFTSLSAMPVAVADGAAFTNATPGILWLSDTASSTAGSGAFCGVFGSQSAVQDFSKGLKVKGGFHIRGDGFRADYAGLAVDGYVGIDHGPAEPFAFPAGLACAEGTVARVTAGAAAPANITGTAFPKRLELAPGSHAYVDVLNGGPADCTAAGVAFAEDSTVRLVLSDSMIPAGTYPVFTGISELPAALPKIAGHLADLENAEWVIHENALAVKITVTGAVGTLTWRPAAAGESAVWSGSAANWTNAAGQAVAFSSGCSAVFDGAEPSAAGTVTVAEGQTPGPVVFSGARDYVLAGAKLGGGSAFVKGGAGMLTIDGGGLAAQPVTVSGGVLKLGANAAAGALGNAAAPVTVESGGTFDVNYTAEDRYDFARSELTHGKVFKIAGEGADGRGALVNNGPGESLCTFSRIELTGDAAIGGTNRLDTRGLDNSAAMQKRPLITGPGHTLTFKNTKLFGVVNTDVDVGKIIVSGGGALQPEGDTSITAPGGIELADGTLKPYALGREFALPVTAVSGSNKIQSASGKATFTGPVTVQEGADLELSGSSSSAFKGAVTNNGALRVTGGVQQFLCPVRSAAPLEISGGQVDWGYGAGSPWPALEDNRTIALNGGSFRLFPPGPRAEGDLTLTGGNGQVWFLGSAAADVLTLTNTEIRAARDIYLGNPFNYGMVTFGEGVRIAAGFLGLGEGDKNPKSTQARLLPGSELHVAGETRIGHWSGDSTEYQHELAVDGGAYVNTNALTVVGWHSAGAALLMNGGVMDVKGIKLREDAGKLDGKLNAGNTSEHFVMSGGLLKMGTSGLQANGYFSANDSGVFFNGGVMTNTAPWGATRCAAVVFSDGPFEWDLGENLVNFNPALQGRGDVTLRGNAAFNSGGDVHERGTVRGRWTVANAGLTSLRNAAAFTEGLTLEEGASATVDIRDAGYVRFGKNRKVSLKAAKTSLLADAMPFIHTGIADAWSLYAYAGEFFVPEGMAGTWTFAESFDDELYLAVDGTDVLNDNVYNKTATKQINLAAGWHAFKLVCYNGAGAAGPQAGDWKNKQMGVGWTNAAVTATDASAYTRFSPDKLAMRPGAVTAGERMRLAGNSLYWSHHQGKTDDWKTITDWNTTAVTNSIKAVSTKSVWQPGKESVNKFSGWFLVTDEQAGSWMFWGSYDDRCALWVDGFDAGIDGRDSGGKQYADRTFELAPGWHRFEFRIYDKGGSWGPWYPSQGAALQYQINGNGLRHAFDEDSLAFRASLASPNTEFGFIGGDLELKAGSTLRNASDGGPCALTGTLKGAGMLEGRFAFATNAVWEIAGTASGLTDVAAFGEGAYPQALAGLRKVRLSFSGRPVRTRYEVCDALGLEGKTEEELAGIEIEASDPEGNAYPFHAAVSGGKFVLVNDAPPGTLLILR